MHQTTSVLCCICVHHGCYLVGSDIVTVRKSADHRQDLAVPDMIEDGHQDRDESLVNKEPFPPEGARLTDYSHVVLDVLLFTLSHSPINGTYTEPLRIWTPTYGSR